jgi:hypothetical protein
MGCSSEDLQQWLRILVDNVREPERTAQVLALEAKELSPQRSKCKRSDSPMRKLIEPLSTYEREVQGLQFEVFLIFVILWSHS